MADHPDELTPVVAVTPALDERDSIAAVVAGLLPRVDHVVVVDNGSRDGTGEVARQAGADVVREPVRGYGAACLAGIGRALELGAGTLVLLDADGSDDPSDLPRLLEPMRSRGAELVLGVRDPSMMEPGAMTGSQRFGNWLAPALMRLVLGAPYRDMPPFKALRRSAVEALELSDTGYGFTVELLIKAHLQGLVTEQVGVRCRRRRAGDSKVSGNAVAAARAGVRILSAVARHGFAHQFSGRLRGRLPRRRKAGDETP